MGTVEDWIRYLKEFDKDTPVIFSINKETGSVAISTMIDAKTRATAHTLQIDVSHI